MDYWLIISRIDSIFGLFVTLVTAFFAFKAWRKTSMIFEGNRKLAAKDELRQKRLRELIQIELYEVDSDGKATNRSLTLPYKPRRDQLSRSELLGILGTYYGQERFDPALIKPILDNGALNRVLAGEDDAESWDEKLQIPWPAIAYSKVESNARSV